MSIKVLIINEGPHDYNGRHNEGDNLTIAAGEAVEVSEQTAERLLSDHGESKWHKFKRGLEPKAGEKLKKIEKGEA